MFVKVKVISDLTSTDRQFNVYRSTLSSGTEISVALYCNIHYTVLKLYYTVAALCAWNRLPAELKQLRCTSTF